MPLTNAIHESLPYIDREPSAPERSSAQALILAEVEAMAENAPETTPETHPALPALCAENLRIASRTPMTGISTARYEMQEAPVTASSSSAERILAWRIAMQNAWTAKAYLGKRQENLTLLDSYGKNAWLEGNKTLEDILMRLEVDMEEKRVRLERLAIERKNAQEAAGGEIKALEEAWKRGVGRVLETELAAEGVRKEVLERRRGGAL